MPGDRFQLGKDPGTDPLITPGPQRGRRTLAVRDAVIGAAQDEDLDQFFEDDAVRNPWPVTAEGMGIHRRRNQGGKLFPEGRHDRYWQGRHTGSWHVD